MMLVLVASAVCAVGAALLLWWVTRWPPTREFLAMRPRFVEYVEEATMRHRQLDPSVEQVEQVVATVTSGVVPPRRTGRW